MARSLIKSALSRELLPEFGFPYDGRAHSFLQRPPHECRFQQTQQISVNDAQALRQPCPIELVHILVGEIHCGFDQSQKTHQFPPRIPEPLRQAPLQLSE